MKSCDICQRTVPTQPDYDGGRLRGHLCQHCTQLIVWLESNGWWAQQTMKYLMRQR